MYFVQRQIHNQKDYVPRVFYHFPGLDFAMAIYVLSGLKWNDFTSAFLLKAESGLFRELHHCNQWHRINLLERVKIRDH